MVAVERCILCLCLFFLDAAVSSFSMPHTVEILHSIVPIFSSSKSQWLDSSLQGVQIIGFVRAYLHSQRRLKISEQC